MIFVNGYPVMIADGLENQIILTDTAKSEASIVHMDKAHAPASKKLVWVQIVNRKFDRSRAESDTNRRFEYEFWMWVDYVLSPEFPANFRYDENGDPIVDANGLIDLGDWKNRPGIVRVYLREHKHVLTRQIALDNVNVFNRLQGVLNYYNELSDDPYFHAMDWIQISEFIGSETHRIKLDYEVEYTDGESQPIDTEYPPGIPVNCFWQQLKLSECLELLLRNYECRILTRTQTRPTDAEFEDPNIPLSYLQWRYRRQIEYDTSLTYTRINWPVYSEEQQMFEDASGVVVPTLTGLFAAQQNIIAEHHYYPTNTFFLSGLYTHVCDLAYYTSGNPTAYGSNQVTLAVIDYVKNSHVNMTAYYAFETPHLPKSYYETKEWSRITIRASTERQDYLVEHHEREGARISKKVYENLSTQSIFTGTVVSVSNGFMQLANIVDLTADKVYDGVKTVPVNFNSFNGVPIASGDFVTLSVTGTSIIGLGIDTRHEYPEEVIEPLWIGQPVTNITWTCPNWAFNPGDSYFQHPLWVTNPAYSYLKCYNYTYHDHVLVNTSNQSEPFATLVYETQVNNNTEQLFRSPTTSNQARVTFRSLATDEEIEEYIDARGGLTRFAKDIPTLKSMMIEDWKRRFQYITFHIGFHKMLTTMVFFHSKFQVSNFYRSTSMHPDIVAAPFHRGFTHATELPYTWDTEPFTDVFGSSAGLGTWEAENGVIELMLSKGYIKRFSELPITVTVNT